MAAGRVFFTANEKCFLKDIIHKHIHIIGNKSSDVIAVSQKRKSWETITELFNSHPGNQKRTWLQLRKCWENMKMRRKLDLANRKTRTGGNLNQRIRILDSLESDTESEQKFFLPEDTVWGEEQSTTESKVVSSLLRLDETVDPLSTSTIEVDNLEIVRCIPSITTPPGKTRNENFDLLTDEAVDPLSTSTEPIISIVRDHTESIPCIPSITIPPGKKKKMERIDAINIELEERLKNIRSERLWKTRLYKWQVRQARADALLSELKLQKERDSV